MNKLISHPFELQLNTWFYDVAKRIANSAAYNMSFQGPLAELRAVKESLLSEFRQSSPLTKELHQELTAGASALLQSVSIAEGPTQFAWLNEPLLQIEAFLAGDDKDAQLFELLKNANEEATSLPRADLLRTGVRSLMLWSEGHKTLSGLELKTEVERLVAEAHKQNEVGEQSLTLEQLLNLCAHTEGLEQQHHFEAFTEALEAWESDFSILEEQITLVLADDCELLDSAADAYESVQEALDDEASFCEVNSKLQNLQQAWDAACAEFLPLIDLRTADQPDTDFENLESLLEVVSGFQSGVASFEEFTTEVQAHKGRWDKIAEDLETAWKNQDQRLRTVSNVGLALNTLLSVQSPGDARLAPIASLYCQSLKSLLVGA